MHTVKISRHRGVFFAAKAKQPLLSQCRSNHHTQFIIIPGFADKAIDNTAVKGIRE